MLKAALPDDFDAIQKQVDEGLKQLLADRKLTAIPKEGRVFLVVNDIAGLVENPPALSLLVPVTSYKEFRETFLTADERKTFEAGKNGVDEVKANVFGGEHRSYMVDLKEYVALSPDKNTAETYTTKYTKATTATMARRAREVVRLRRPRRLREPGRHQRQVRRPDPCVQGVDRLRYRAGPDGRRVSGHQQEADRSREGDTPGHVPGGRGLPRPGGRRRVPPCGAQPPVAGAIRRGHHQRETAQVRSARPARGRGQAARGAGPRTADRRSARCSSKPCAG